MGVYDSMRWWYFDSEYDFLNCLYLSTSKSVFLERQTFFVKRSSNFNGEYE